MNEVPGEIARLFPAAVVVGLDISDTSFKGPMPDNYLLRVGNVLTGLPFPDAFFLGWQTYLEEDALQNREVKGRAA